MKKIKGNCYIKETLGTIKNGKKVSNPQLRKHRRHFMLDFCFLSNEV